MAHECPVCRRPVSHWRTFTTTAWGSWTCPDCGSRLGIDARRRFLALIPWTIVLFFLLIVLNLFQVLGVIPALLVLLPMLFVIISLFDRPIVLERIGLRCEQCGYDLQGQVEPVCPECGHELGDEEMALLERVRSGEPGEASGYRQRVTRRTRTWQIAMIALVITLVAFVFAGVVIWRGRSSGAMAVQPETKLLLDAVLKSVQRHGGHEPGHILGPLAEDVLTTHQFVLPWSATDRQRIDMGGTSLAEFDTLDSARQREIIGAMSEALTDGVIAHRVGDFAFAWHGIDLPATGDARDLWLVIGWPDPDQNPPPGPGDRIPVGLADGAIRLIDAERFAAMLTVQNELRRRLGVPPLPDPGTITHDRPAVAGDQ